MLRTSLATLLLLVLPSIAHAAPEWKETNNASYKSVALSAFASELAMEDDPVAARGMVRVYEADLNMDGQSELFAENRNFSNCGSAGCSMILLSRVNGAFKTLLQVTASIEMFEITDRVSHGYRAFQVPSGPLWIFNGRKYDVGSFGDTQLAEGSFDVPSTAATLPTGRYWVSVRNVQIAPSKQNGLPWDGDSDADLYVGIRVEGSSSMPFEFACRAPDTTFIACDLSQNPFDVTPSTKLSIRVLDEDAMFNDMIGTSARPISPMTDCPKSGVCTVPTTQQLQSFSLEFHRIQ